METIAFKKSYTDKLKDPRWQKKRLQILERDKWKCCLCNDGKICLNVHHKKYHGEPWDAPNEELITYCEHCHLLIELDEIEFYPIVKVKKIIRKDGVITIFAVRKDKPNLYLFNLYPTDKNLHTIGALDIDYWDEIKEFHKNNING